MCYISDDNLEWIKRVLSSPIRVLLPILMADWLHMEKGFFAIQDYHESERRSNRDSHTYIDIWNKKECSTSCLQVFRPSLRTGCSYISVRSCSKRQGKCFNKYDFWKRKRIFLYSYYTIHILCFYFFLNIIVKNHLSRFHSIFFLFRKLEWID